MSKINVYSLDAKVVKEIELNESFSKLTVFLDTNVVFGLLNFADTEVNIACREIISLMQQQKYIEKHCNQKY